VRDQLSLVRALQKRDAGVVVRAEEQHLRGVGPTTVLGERDARSRL